MLLRDLQHLVRERFKALAEGRAWDARAAMAAASRANVVMATGRKQDFAPLIPPERRPVAVWVIDNRGRLIHGYNEAGTLVRRSAFDYGRGSGPFVEGADGFFYGVVQYFDGPSAFDVRRLRLAGPAETLLVLPQGWSAVLDSDAIMINREGDVFLKVQPASGDRPWAYKRLVSGWSLQDAGGVDRFSTSHVVTIEDPNDPTKWCVVRRHLDTYRCWRQAILGDGRWVAADPLIIATIDVPDGTAECGISYDQTRPGTARAWGDAWWGRAHAAVPWSAVANTGVSTDPRTIVPPYRWTDYGGDKMAREARVVGVLPPPTRVVFFNGYDQQGYLRWIEAFPIQDADQLLADATSLYYLGRGAVSYDSYDPFNPNYVPDGVYRTDIPAAGSVPSSWVKIIDEPSGHFWGMAVSRDHIWTLEYNDVMEPILVSYMKSGTGRRVVKNFGVRDAGDLQLTPAFAARWV